MQRYIALDALRGIAAIIVLFFHERRWIDGSPVFASGYLAVDFFFMLSGFVIASAYQKKLASGLLGFWDFAVLRVIRLYPMVMVGAALGAFVALVSAWRHNGIDLNVVVSVSLPFLLIPQLGAQELFPTNIPLWSLFYELLVNLVFAAVIPFSGRKTAIAVISVSFIWLCFRAAGLAEIAFFSGVARTTFSFMLGVSLFHARSIRPVTRPQSALWPSIVVLIVSLTINGGALIGKEAYEFVCVIFIFPPLIWYSANIVQSTKGILASEKLGALSYPLYATHGPMLSIIELTVSHTGITSGISLFLLCPPIILSANIIIARVWDAPVRRLLKRIWRRRQESAAANRLQVITAAVRTE